MGGHKLGRWRTRNRATVADRRSRDANGVERVGAHSPTSRPIAPALYLAAYVGATHDPRIHIPLPHLDAPVAGA